MNVMDAADAIGATLTPAQREAIEEAMERARLVEFVGDVAQLADQRPDLELRNLIDQLHADLRPAGED